MVIELDAELVEKAKEFNKPKTSGNWHEGIPGPDAGYSRPLDRAIYTTVRLLEVIIKEQRTEFRDIITEHLRDRVTRPTCDKRRTRQYLRATYPNHDV
ncbi:hypothetical protein CEK25_002258 [Fusarium fujikuroi]|nr:hypothetical protein CEK25_002258 [Fusarium fujikuroi]